METSPQYLETSAQYREFAEECDRLAKQATTEGYRKILEEMAEAWRMMTAGAGARNLNVLIKVNAAPWGSP